MPSVNTCHTEHSRGDRSPWTGPLPPTYRVLCSPFVSASAPTGTPQTVGHPYDHH